MSSAKHEKSFVDFEKGYEQNIIGLKGIIYFGVGLLLLIIITFGLMWALHGVLEEDAQETKGFTNPMRAQMKDKDKLPPEPRLQAAPGFGVDTETGRVNLELKAPQAEYWELRKAWDKILAEGIRDPKTGTVMAMPVDKAKELLLQRAPKARFGPEAEKTLNDSKMHVSDSSAGRIADVKWR
ncbi:MAG: hypothetical protein IT174_13860 [Acidobacteria bacterium]|nr:hypothetical protein [Acidobacteriota bacterium]